MTPLLWITLANACYLLAYTVRDMLWLRALSIVGALLMVPYYVSSHRSAAAPIAWAGVFTALNAYWLVRLLLERRPVVLNDEETRLKLLAFPSLNDRDARRLFSLGRWDDLSGGASIVAHDTRARRFSVIYSGVANVYHDGRCISELGAGQFVGAIDRNAEALDLDVIVAGSARVVCWDRADFDAFMDQRLDAALALERTLGLELRRLLDRSLAAGV